MFYENHSFCLVRSQALHKLGKLFILNLTSHFLFYLVEPYPIHAQLSISNRLKGNPCRCLELFLCIAPSCLVLCPHKLQLPQPSQTPVFVSSVHSAPILYFDSLAYVQAWMCLQEERGDWRVYLTCFPFLHRVTVLCLLFLNILKQFFSLYFVQFSSC